MCCIARKRAIGTQKTRRINRRVAENKRDCGGLEAAEEDRDAGLPEDGREGVFAFVVGIGVDVDFGLEPDAVGEAEREAEHEADVEAGVAPDVGAGVAFGDVDAEEFGAKSESYIWVKVVLHEDGELCGEDVCARVVESVCANPLVANFESDAEVEIAGEWLVFDAELCAE